GGLGAARNPPPWGGEPVPREHVVSVAQQMTVDAPGGDGRRVRGNGLLPWQTSVALSVAAGCDRGPVLGRVGPFPRDDLGGWRRGRRGRVTLRRVTRAVTRPALR